MMFLVLAMVASTASQLLVQVSGLAWGAKKAWGDKDRDLIELQYTVTYTYTDKGVTHVKKYTCKDNLVMQSRENKYETFEVTYNK